MRLALAALLMAALADGGGLDPAAGRILVAGQGSRDPDLARTVVLLVHYDRDGAIGLVLNRPTAVPLSRMYPGMRSQSAVYLGGPVAAGGRALMRSSTARRNALRVFGDVFVFSDRNLMEEAVTQGAGPDRFRVYAGYTGWSVAQLAAELRAGLWRVIPGDAEVVFCAAPEKIWARLAQRFR
jgi:putative transcriptional regulator